jgi:hypothetical protein
MLDFAGPPPDASDLSRRWHLQLASGRAVVAALPPEEAGKCVLDHGGNLVRDPADSLTGRLERNELHFHPGSIRGALPQIRIPDP